MTTTTLDPSISPYLRGAFAPVAEERTIEDLTVRGSLPPELSGLYLRNGPNPWPMPTGPYDWFAGAGMVHCVRLSGGRATWYRNRRIDTEHAGGPPEPFPAGANAANTSVVRHAGRTLALYEVGLPHELDGELATVGRDDFDGALQGPMTAHPKLDPVTGELHFFGYIPDLRSYVADPQGRITSEVRIPTERLGMKHDFSLTASSVVFYDLAVVFDPSLLASGATVPFTWRPETGARIGVVPRGAPAEAMR